MAGQKGVQKISPIRPDNKLAARAQVFGKENISGYFKSLNNVMEKRQKISTMLSSRVLAQSKNDHRGFLQLKDENKSEFCRLLNEDIF